MYTKLWGFIVVYNVDARITDNMLLVWRVVVLQVSVYWKRVFVWLVTRNKGYRGDY